MASRSRYDVVIVGSGPNGLAAGIAFARAGLATLIVEAHDTPGGGARTAALTRPGFLHDVCSTVHPLGVASPWFRELALEDCGLSWIQSPAALAHVLPDGRAITLERSVEATAEQLGRDGRAYRDRMAPFVDNFDALLEMILRPLRFPREPLAFARFGIAALRSMRGLSRAWFRDEAAPALLSGIAAHAMVPLEEAATASFGLVLAMAGHAAGWPIAHAGSAAITRALLARFREHGGELVLGERVGRLAQLPTARAYVLDVTPRQLLEIAGDRLPAGYRARLARFRYGPGVYKIDWALRGPVPWRDPRCARAATVHLSGSATDIAAGERAVHARALPARPFVLFVQASLFDPSRAPPGQHTAWAYCHVPSSSAIDASAAIEGHIEAFAPGFRDLVIARHTANALDIASYNPNYVGGDINGGLSDLSQLFFRPVARIDPYATPAPDVFLCSSSTPPGGGVHGMCGYWAARSVLRRLFGHSAPPLGERTASDLDRTSHPRRSPPGVIAHR
jgi:phytoene dehydrogenase-like protein